MLVRSCLFFEKGLVIPMRIIVKFFLLLFVGAGLSIEMYAVSPATASDAGRGVIRVNRANIRQAPEKQSQRLFSLRRNHKVTILKEQGRWFYVASQEGQRGWVFDSLVRVIKPSKMKPEIKIFSNDLSASQKTFCRSLVARLRTQLAAVKPQGFDFLISRVASGKQDIVLGTSGVVSEKTPGFWLMILRSHFSREKYQQVQAAAAGIKSGTIDLLLYRNRLKVMLDAGELLLAEIKRNPGQWSASLPVSQAVKILLVLQSESGDQIAFGGFCESGLPVFNDFMILEIHGFSPFSIHATIPANVADFNQFDLPAPYLANGNRSTAALAHDFFGFPY